MTPRLWGSLAAGLLLSLMAGVGVGVTAHRYPNLSLWVVGLVGGTFGFGLTLCAVLFVGGLWRLR